MHFSSQLTEIASVFQRVPPTNSALWCFKDRPSWTKCFLGPVGTIRFLFHYIKDCSIKCDRRNFRISFFLLYFFLNLCSFLLKLALFSNSLHSSFYCIFCSPGCRTVKTVLFLHFCIFQVQPSPCVNRSGFFNSLCFGLKFFTFFSMIKPIDLNKLINR